MWETGGRRAPGGPAPGAVWPEPDPSPQTRGAHCSPRSWGWVDGHSAGPTEGNEASSQLFPCLCERPSLLQAVLPDEGGERTQTRAWGAWATPRPVTLFLSASSPQEFVQLARRLVRDPALGAELVAQGREYVRTRHSWQAERDTYQRLVRTLEGDSARGAR